MYKEKGYSLIEICCVCTIIIMIGALCCVHFFIIRSSVQDSLIEQRLASLPIAVFSLETNDMQRGVCAAPTMQSIFKDIITQSKGGIAFATTALPSNAETLMATCHDNGMYGQGWAVSVPLLSKKGQYACIDHVQHIVTKSASPLAPFAMQCS